jgi:hypothetical protein
MFADLRGRYTADISDSPACSLKSDCIVAWAAVFIVSEVKGDIAERAEENSWWSASRANLAGAGNAELPGTKFPSLTGF